MATISARSTDVIERPVRDVWAFVSDPRNEPKWHTDILEIKSAADQEGGPGTSWVLGERLLVTVKFMGRREYEVEVTGLEPDHRLEITTRTGPMKPVATYMFESVDENTRFTRQVDIPVEGPFRLLLPVMRRSTQKRNARFVQNLKAILER